jgi:hypothetical protein
MRPPFDSFSIFASANAPKAPAPLTATGLAPTLPYRLFSFRE